MSAHSKDKPTGQPVDTSVPVVPRTAKRIVRYLKRTGSIALVIVFAVLMLSLVLAIPVGYYWGKHKVALIQSSEPAGQVMAVTLTDAWIPSALVETDTGFYTLIHGVSLPKGQGLTLQTRAVGARYLCDDRPRCTQLVDAR